MLRFNKYIILLIYFIFEAFPVKAESIISNNNILESSQIKIFTVSGNSMSPMIKNGQKVKADFRYYETNKIKRYDLVIAELAAHKREILKRIMGIPEDSLELVYNKSGCTLKLNNKLLVNSAGSKYLLNKKECKLLGLYVKNNKGPIPKDAYLLLGDNLKASKDSRKFGLINKSHIKAKATIVNTDK